MRILSKGSELPFVHKSVGWDESTNFKDYDIVFVNLRSLEESAQDFDHPYNESTNSPEFFIEKDMIEFIRNDGYMIIYLPKSSTVFMGEKAVVGMNDNGEITNIYPRDYMNIDTESIWEYNLFDWLPFSLRSRDECGKSVEIYDDDWKWYFRNTFDWSIILQPISRGYYSNAIAKNSYGGNISQKISTDSGYGGYIALIPPDDSTSYSEFVKKTLENVFDIESGVKGRAPPSWVSDYALPNESNIERNIQKKKEEIDDLEDQLDSITKFKQLLYERDTNLEEITRKALRELGFSVDGEIPGKRDGIFHTTDIDFALEITGTSGGIKLSKARQLDEWVGNLVAESSVGESGKDVSGLLIVNAEMDTSPEERDISIEPNVRGYMERRGDYKVLTTVDLYRLVKCSIEEGVEKEDVEQIFYQDDTLLSLPDELYS